MITVHDDVGRGNFVAIYLSGGVMASLVSLSRFVITNKLLTTSLGASGALTAVLAAWCCVHSGYVLIRTCILSYHDPRFLQLFQPRY